MDPPMGYEVDPLMALELFGLYEDMDPPETVRMVLLRMRYANGTYHDRPQWMLDLDSRWVDIAGGSWDKKEYDISLRHQEVHGRNWESLEWSDTDLVSPEFNSGWLAPDGAFTGCSPWTHDLVVRLVLRSTVGEIEKTYARVGDSHVMVPQGNHRFTERQILWLRARNIPFEDPRNRERREIARIGGPRKPLSGD